ncbi:uncharacterized protein SETTUDRAFT_37488 [Exserohilum turcica Et28A]|uniref:Ig-like domain-containing protein n=1 Tax=Exserohilum turcicum (strain 28A) TaxID=671987 RepID=R0KL07_EXST2|nr:uncharacterized protein SETTUDRAFT_37488 [Exserohilum turcica Et28A]EOA89839.1 hypothetical protein SETTUDRAFT_37488 [Exserohilum turcica Et28A]
MLGTHLLAGLLCAYAAVAISMPQHEPQQPLLAQHKASGLDSQTVHVMLVYTESGSKMERVAQIPLHKRILPGALLGVPTRPFPNASWPGCHSLSSPVKSLISRLGLVLPRQLDTIKIVAAATGQGRSVALERLDSITCKITTDVDDEGEQAPAGLPWFSLKDGTVRIKDTPSKWFLGSRRIQSYKCR